MKKNILVVLLCAALLAGCDFNLESIRFWEKKSSEPESEQKQEEKDQNSQEKPENNENQNSGENTEDIGNNEKPEGGEHGGNENQNPPVDEYTKTIFTSGTEFASRFSGGTHFDTETKQTQLFEYLTEQFESENLLSSIDCVNLHTQNYDSDTFMSLGSSSNTGSFKLNFFVKVYKLELTAQCYAKPPYSEDSNAKVKIDNDASQLLKTGEQLEFQTILKDYESGTNSFTIQSVDGRVFLKSIKITWRL